MVLSLLYSQYHHPHQSLRQAGKGKKGNGCLAEQGGQRRVCFLAEIRGRDTPPAQGRPVRVCRRRAFPDRPARRGRAAARDVCGSRLRQGPCEDGGKVPGGGRGAGDPHGEFGVEGGGASYAGGAGRSPGWV